MTSIIVVEGIHDEMKIKSIYKDANVVTTNGSEISKATLEFIKELSETNEIIIFTDPDAPGEKIRKKILEVVPQAKHAFIRKKDAISKNKRKIGIEHASQTSIIESLGQIFGRDMISANIQLIDLYELGLMGQTHSSVLRGKISEVLNIGKPNAKTFLNRINMLGITKEELKKQCQKLEIMDL